MKYLIIGGGSMAVYSFMGVLCKLQESGSLDDLEEISGASAGCLAAVAFGIGRSDINLMMTRVFDIDVAKCTTINIINFVKKFGFIKHDTFKIIISRLFQEYFNVSDLTFEEYFKRTNIKLHISAFSLHKRTTQYFSYYTSPDFSVIDAMSMSISIPIMMIPYKGYLDGSLVEEIPYMPFVDKKTDDVIVIKHRGTDIKYENTKSISSYIQLFLGLFYVIRPSCPILYKTYYAHTKPDANLFNFKLTHFDKMQLYSYGYLLSS
jgi:predicted acylesterase/phospholipase RssA